MVTQMELIARGYAAAMRTGRIYDAKLCVELMEAECETARKALSVEGVVATAERVVVTHYCNRCGVYREKHTGCVDTRPDMESMWPVEAP